MPAAIEWDQDVPNPAGTSRRVKIGAAIAGVAVVAIVAATTAGGKDDSSVQALRASENSNEALLEATDCSMQADVGCRGLDVLMCGPEYTGCEFLNGECVVKEECICFDQPPYLNGCLNETMLGYYENGAWDGSTCREYEGCLWDPYQQECYNNDLCREYLDSWYPPTSSPTTSPTPEPTNEPTSSPTKWPTSAPTSSPTMWPTSSPTKWPTSSPTSSPTKWPTSSPTSSPTASPTASPTSSPTVSPTASPVVGPTPEPTVPINTTAPTTTPTASPTPKKAGWGR